VAATENAFSLWRQWLKEKDPDALIRLLGFYIEHVKFVALSEEEAFTIYLQQSAVLAIAVNELTVFDYIKQQRKVPSTALNHHFFSLLFPNVPVEDILYPLLYSFVKRKAEIILEELENANSVSKTYSNSFSFWDYIWEIV
jgi:hypothetical protein